LNQVVDGYGVGTWISAAPVVDFSMDIVEIDGEPVAKRGKWSGAKQVLRCVGCLEDDIVALHQTDEWPESCPDCGSDLEPLLTLQMRAGEPTGAQLAPSDIRQRMLQRLESFEINWEDDLL
jgi:nicotinate phosphoribosyltransferase